MSDITLEQVDIIRERTGITYAEAKESLEICNGNVVDALIYIEGKKKDSDNSNTYTTKAEFVNWIKDLVRKGNITRIKIKRDEKVIVDIPVNAGIAVTGIAYIMSAPLLALGVLTAVVTKVSVEITKEDGSVEVVNKIIRNTVSDVRDKFDNMTEGMNLKDKLNGFTGDKKFKDKFSGFKGEVKEKFSSISDDVIQKVSEVKEDVREKLNNKQNNDDFEGNVYKYTVKFEEVKDETVDDEKK